MQKRMNEIDEACLALYSFGSKNFLFNNIVEK